jgi:hypothetical protein
MAFANAVLSSLGDVLGGRTQVSKSPVRYATHLHEPNAHVHDLADTRLFWQQVVLQSAVGLLVGVALISLSGAQPVLRDLTATSQFCSPPSTPRIRQQKPWTMLDNKSCQ